MREGSVTSDSWGGGGPPQRPPEPSPRPATGLRGVVWALVALLFVRLTLANGLGILADEAYYWTWSRVPAAGYFDHPPAVAWLIAASARLLGDTVLGVRAACVLAGGLAAAVLVPRAREPGLLLLLLGGLPLFALGGIFATPDVPLLLGWAVALAAALKGRWTLAGVGVGVACLGKLTGWGLWPLLLVGAPREARRMVPGMALTLAIAAPNLAWLARHDLVSLRFQLGHGLGAISGGPLREPPGIAGAATFVAAQAGLVGPVLFLAAVAWMAVGWRGDREARLLWWTSAPVLGFFAFAATRAHGEANWAAPAWLGACVALARAGGRLGRAAWVGGGVGALLSGVVLLHAWVPLGAFPNDPVSRLGEAEDLAQSVSAWGVPVVYTERYQEAALLRFHTGLDAWALPGAGRPDQFDLWTPPAAERALFVRPWRGGPALPSDAVCTDRGPSHDVLERGRAGEVVERWQVVEVGGCAPGRPGGTAP